MHLHETIACAIRDEILSGRLRPGERLPPRTAFEQRFATTPVTVQRAFARLIADGFVKALPKQGTFVADPPPHLREYNLLIYSHRTPPLWGNKFWATLDRVAAEISRTTSRRVRIRTGVTPEHPQDDSYRELVYDIRAKRLAGIAFLFGPGLAHDSLLLGAKDLPKVSLMAHSIPGLPQIVLNGRQYWEKALDHLQREGRNRVAIITPSGVDASVWARVRKGAQARGMACEDRWIQAVDLAFPHWAGNVTELLLSGPAGERPDAFVISDDNLIDHACRGMLAAGMQPGKELSVIAHANYPIADAGPLPLCRLGYDLRTLVETTMDTLDRIRQGEQFPEPILIPAMFEPEIATATATDARFHIQEKAQEVQYVP